MKPEITSYEDVYPKKKQTVSSPIEQVVSMNSSGESLPRLCKDCGAFVRENCTCINCLFGD